MLDIDTTRLDNVRPAKQIFCEITDLDPLSRGAGTIPREVEVKLRDADGPKQVAMWRGFPPIVVGTGVRCWRAGGDTQILEIAGGGGSSSTGQITLNKYDATTAPTVNEDSGDGYGVGSHWVDVTNDNAYILVDATVASAVWVQTNAGGTIGAWTTFSPDVTQSSSVAATVDFAQYKLVDDVCHMQVRLSVTAAGTTANAIVIGNIPAAAQPSDTHQLAVIGPAMVYRSGLVYYSCVAVAVGASDIRFWAAAEVNYLGISPSYALASGDDISFQATYKV